VEGSLMLNKGDASFMQGLPLITRQAEPDDRLGQVLTVASGKGQLMLQGILLRPLQIKNYILSNTSLERFEIPESIELFSGEETIRTADGKEEKRQRLLGAGVLTKKNNGADGFVIEFNIELLDDSIIEEVKSSVGKLGLTAFERLYPIMPVFEIKSEDLYCSICDEQLNQCSHNVGEGYSRVTCRAQVRQGAIKSLIWSGVREDFN
jgi:hypothetical protein